MALEVATTINQLDPANPAGTDRLAKGDDHIRLIKAALKATFPQFTGPLNLSNDYLNTVLMMSVVPFGAIVDWYGSAAACPSGWAICNGVQVARSDGTGTIVPPDLRGRVTAGATVANPTGTLYGQDSQTVTTEAGGANTPTATATAAGAHTHALSLSGTVAPADAGVTLQTTNRILDGSGGTSNIATAALTSVPHTHTVALTGDVGAVGDHTHALTVSAIPGHGHSVTVPVAQATMALHKIMKV